MTQTPPAPVNNSFVPTIIADHICNQVIEFQELIAARPKGERFPSQPEANLQSRLINNILRLKKQNATDHAAKFVKDFIRFMSRNSKELAAQVTGQYVDFIKEYAPALAGQQDNAQQATGDIQVKEDMYLYSESEFSRAPLAAVRGLQSSAATAPAADIQEYLIGHEPPFPRADYEQYKHLLHDYESGYQHTTVMFNGTHVNKQWLEYNLLQYALPLHDRFFIPSPSSYHARVRHSDTRAHISEYLGTIAAGTPGRAA